MKLRRLTFAALALPLVACSEPTVSDKGVEVTLSVDRTVLRPGETAQVTVVAANRGARAVTIASTGCPAAFVVVDRAGAVIRPGPQICTLIASTLELAAGESHSFRYAWALDGASGGASAPQPLGPGTYALQGRVVGAYLRAESAPVEVLVVAAEGTE
jgi:hypothetical protein